MPFFVILAVVMIIVVVSWNPPIVLFTLAIVYALSGPAMAIKGRSKKLREQRKTVGSVAQDLNSTFKK